WSLGAAIIFNRDPAWNDQWIFWVGPFIRAALAAVYHQIQIITTCVIDFPVRDLLDSSLVGLLQALLYKGYARFFRSIPSR
ncbi:hypothetical protein S245_060678, partial [Arachis hypogaea]